MNFINFDVESAVILFYPNSDVLNVRHNEELCNVNEWLRESRFSLSIDKTSYMIISNTTFSFPDYCFNGEVFLMNNHDVIMLSI